MGVWGTGSFDNDDALDWVEHLTSSDLEAVEGALRQTIEGSQIDPPIAARGIAAAETVATLLGQAGRGIPQAVIRWAQARDVAPSRAIIESATSAVRRTATNELLAGLWRSLGLLAEWRAHMDDLLGRRCQVEREYWSSPIFVRNVAADFVSFSELGTAPIALKIQPYLANLTVPLENRG